MWLAMMLMTCRTSKIDVKSDDLHLDAWIVERIIDESVVQVDDSFHLMVADDWNAQYRFDVVLLEVESRLEGSSTCRCHLISNSSRYKLR